MDSSGSKENDEIQVVKVSLEKPVIEFGHWLVIHMDHSGLPLYLILHPEAVEALKDAKPIGLEVNLPQFPDSTCGLDKYDRGRRKPRIDLIFKKNNDYYLIEIIDREKITPYYKKKVMDLVRRFKENLGPEGFQPRVIPIIVHPENLFPQLTLTPTPDTLGIDPQLSNPQSSGNSFQ